MTTWWIGTYPAAGAGSPVGEGEGLWRVGAADGAAQATTQPSPSFVVAHPALPLVYAVAEASPTVVTVHAAADGRELAAVTTGGEGGCHLLLGPDPDAPVAVYVSHYGSGELGVIPLGADGLPVSGAPQQLLGHAGAGPRADRQEAPHAHSATMSPDGKHVLVADLGTDELRRYTVGPGGLLGDAGIAATLPPGSGPRHMAVRGELLYLVCELRHTIATLRWNRAAASADVLGELPTTLAPHRKGEDTYDAHVAIVPRAQGDVLLASVRGPDVVAVFDVAPEGELTYRGAINAGHWPRHFTVAGGSLVVAAQRDHELRIFDLDHVLALAPETENGTVASVPFRTVAVPSPACITWVP